MKLKLHRRYFGATYTIGTLYINGKYFCDTLEDTVRASGVKIPGKTAISAGKYNVVLRNSPRFKRMLPLIIGVPMFNGILIHRGNTAEDSAGCILVGENKAKGKVLNSTKYEIALVEILKKHTEITIEIV